MRSEKCLLATALMLSASMLTASAAFAQQASSSFTVTVMLVRPSPAVAANQLCAAGKPSQVFLGAPVRVDCPVPPSDKEIAACKNGSQPHPAARCSEVMITF